MSDTRPQDGDIVIARESTSSVQYAIRQVPGIAQFGTSSQGEALQLARRYAREHVVDVWCREHGTYRLLERCRLRTWTETRTRQLGIVRSGARAEGGDALMDDSGELISARPTPQRGWLER